MQIERRKFGLVGKKLAYSFSKLLFEQEYHKHYLDNADYQIFELPSAEKILPLVFEQHIEGLNVTIPFKESVLLYVNELSPEAKKIGSVNVLKISFSAGVPYLKGYNTDAVGFESMIYDSAPCHRKALVLGTGGAAKAVAYVLKKYSIEVTFVSRNKTASDIIAYNTLTDKIIAENTLIVNATPMGTKGFDVEVDIPYGGIVSGHYCIDLVYNPSTTFFMQECRRRGATIQNGMAMLQRQAEESWKIWNEEI